MMRPTARDRRPRDRCARRCAALLALLQALSSSRRAWRPAFCRSRLEVPTEVRRYQVGPEERRSATMTVWLSSSRSSEAPRSPTPIASARWPTTSPAPAARAPSVVVVVSRDGQGDRRADRASPRRCLAASPAARWTCSSPPASARPSRCCAWPCTTSASRRELHRQPGRLHHRHHPHQRQDPRGQRRPDPRRARRRAGARRRRVPGRVDRQGRHVPRSGRLRHHRGRPGPRARRRRLRALHRRVRACSRADPRIVPTPAKLATRQLRRAARDDRLRLPEAAVRSVEFARNHGVPLHVRSSFTWEPGTWVTEEEPAMEQADHLRRHPRHVRGQGHRRRRARPPGHRGAAVPAAGRRPTSTST